MGKWDWTYKWVLIGEFEDGRALRISTVAQGNVSWDESGMDRKEPILPLQDVPTTPTVRRMPQPTFLQEPTPIDMRNLPVSLLLFFIVHPAWSQVGINTTSLVMPWFCSWRRKNSDNNYGGF